MPANCLALQTGAAVPERAPADSLVEPNLCTPEPSLRQRRWTLGDSDEGSPVPKLETGYSNRTCAADSIENNTATLETPQDP